MVFLLAMVAISPLLRMAVFAWADSSSILVPGGVVVYLLSFGHFDGFSLGAIIALYERPIRERRFHAPWLLASVGLLCAFWIAASAQDLSLESLLGNLRRSFSVNTSGGLRPVVTYAVLTFGSGCVIMCALERRRFITTFLNGRFLVYSGNISYGLYLIHVPLQYLFNEACGLTYEMDLLPRVIVFSAYIAILYLLALLSFRYIEKPLRVSPAYSSKSVGEGCVRLKAP